MKGMGVRKLEDRRHAEYVGGMVQGLVPLLDHESIDGMMHRGRRSNEPCKRWLGENSFCPDPNPDSIPTPWATLLSHEDESEIAKGLTLAWTTMQQALASAHDPAVSCRGFLLNEDKTNAGFNSSGLQIKRSVTQKLTTENEKAAYDCIRRNFDEEKGAPSYTTTKHERLAFRNCDDFSRMFLISLPGILGIMNDKVISECFAQYLGLPSPAMRPFVGQYIGRANRSQVVDENGNSVANALLSGADFARGHDVMKLICRDMFKKAGLATAVEVKNMFHGLVPEEAMRRYVTDFERKDAVIPDIMIHNFPPDANAVGNAAVPCIIEIKTKRVDKTGNFYKDKGENTSADRPTVGKRAVETVAINARQSYVYKCGKLDKKCAPDDPTEPFSRALSDNFHSGGAHPMVFGAFGECNKKVKWLVTLCAQLAAARTENSSMTPHEARSAKGSSFHIILSQFKRALGCAASRIAAETKLRRTFLIRPTKQGADIAARSAASNHYNRFSGHSPHWFHSPENEDAFNDFYTYKTHYQNFYDDSFDPESEREE